MLKKKFFFLSFFVFFLLGIFFSRYYFSYNFSFSGHDISSSKEITEKISKNIWTKSTVKNTYVYFKNSSKVDYIEKRLSEKGFPDDLKYIAVIESKLDNYAVSHAGALGVWQFMPETAKRFGLHVNDDIDERVDFEKSTDAALKYFEVLYKKFGDWSLVAAAYNRGENAIADALFEQGVQEYYELDLNEETGNYVYRILGVKFFVELFEDE